MDMESNSLALDKCCTVMISNGGAEGVATTIDVF